MAERRMFAKTIVTSDAFLDMPPTARCLYFTLGMFADDDGFVNNPKSIMRQSGATLDDMNILIAKKFVINFESGVIVIKHWRIHNYIQSDRYHETKYKEELNSLTLDENKAYTLANTEVEALDTECIHDVSKVDTEVRLGKSKDRLGKDKKTDIFNGSDTVSIPYEYGSDTTVTVTDAVSVTDTDTVSNTAIVPKKSVLKDEFETLWSIYPRKQGKEKAFGYYEKARKSGATYEEIEYGIISYIRYIQAEQTDPQYIKMGSTFFSQKAWQDDWTIKQKSSGNGFDDMYRRRTGKGVFDDFR